MCWHRGAVTRKRFVKHCRSIEHVYFDVGGHMTHKDITCATLLFLTIVPTASASTLELQNQDVEDERARLPAVAKDFHLMPIYPTAPRIKIWAVKWGVEWWYHPEDNTSIEFDDTQFACLSEPATADNAEKKTCSPKAKPSDQWVWGGQPILLGTRSDAPSVNISPDDKIFLIDSWKSRPCIKNESAWPAVGLK